MFRWISTGSPAVWQPGAEGTRSLSGDVLWFEKVDPLSELAWFLFPGQFQRGFLSLRDPAPSELGYPFRR